MIFNTTSKSILFALLLGLVLCQNLYAQNTTKADSLRSVQELFDSLCIEGIREFDKNIKHRDLRKTISVLEEAVKLKPFNAKAHYYLAYAYSGLNRVKGAGSAYRDLRLTKKCSEHMSNVIQIQADFRPLLALGPYSKITSEWGAQAFYYWVHHHLDSAILAFKEGLNNGGFGEFSLNIRRLQLSQCPPNTILFTKGDDNFWNFMYLQIIDNFRTDIAIVDLTLLNSLWYQKLLKDRGILNFKLAHESNKAYNIVNWSDTIIQFPLKNNERIYKWGFNARGNNPYFLYYGDEAVLNIVSQNQFSRPVYFTLGVPVEDYHELNFEAQDKILLKQIKPLNNHPLNNQSYDSIVVSIISQLKGFNGNSYDERLLLNSIRKSILNRIYINWLSNDNADNEYAKILLNRLIKQLPVSVYPYLDEEMESMIKNFKRVIIDEDFSSGF